MSQPKVYEFAKELGMETIALMDKIKEWNLPVKSHMAALTEDLVSDIRDRLDAEKAPKTKKKTAKKKVAKKAAAKKVAKKKAVTKKVVKKVTTKASVEAEAKAVEAKPAATTKKTAARKRAVIRRKAAHSPEAEAAAQAEAAQKAAELAARKAAALAGEENEIAPEQIEAGDQATGNLVAASEAEATTDESKSVPRAGGGRIVGRMDLSKVRGTTGAPAGRSDSRPPRPASSGPARGIRTGFVAPMPQFVEPDQSRDSDRKKEERPKKKVGATTKEVPSQNFKAADFRKREVIFQPKKKRANLRGDFKKTQITTPKASKRMVKVHETITVSDLAQEIGVKGPQLIKKLMTSGVMANLNTVLDFDTVALTVGEFGFEAENVHRSVDDLVGATAFGELDAERVIRPPVVTVMGHVDHGKTTLLDSIRKANVAAKEAGGITQHIGAYKVQLDDGAFITFLDTPGHEAFTAMRARGATATDIAVIVVAADDGVMPQTVEAINHAKAAGVPIIVAVNKMDRPGANPDKVKQELTEHEIVPEEWGGNTIFCHVSALKGDGIKELLEQLHLLAEMAELRANPKRSGTGLVIESRLEKGRGAVATLLVQDGTVTVGQSVVAGKVAGRIRAMINDQGKNVKSAEPGDPVEILGLPEAPAAGDRFDVCKDEAAAREISDARKQMDGLVETPNSKMSLEDLFSKVKTGSLQELPVVLKSDVAGSNEAVKGMFEKESTDEVKVKVIHSGVGGISESDVLLASTAGGIVIGFNVRPDTTAQRIAKEKGVEVKTYTIIYELIDDVKKALSGLLQPDIVEKSKGSAEVRETFTVPKVGVIAGCSVTDGKINRADLLRLVRNGRVVYEGKFSSLKRFKDDVKEVAAGYECGIGIENFNDLKVGDVIEAFVKEEVQREL